MTIMAKGQPHDEDLPVFPSLEALDEEGGIYRKKGSSHRSAVPAFARSESNAL